MLRRIVMALALVCVLFPLLPLGGTAAQNAPQGVPAGADQATVTGYIDGDTFKVSLNRHGQTILLAGIDAPEPGDCYAAQATDRIKDLLPHGSKIWLERSGDDKDGKGRLLRYVWVPRDGADAYLLNTKLVREGYAVFDDQHDNPKYSRNIDKWQDYAAKHHAGLWAACGGPHVPSSSQPTPTSVAGLPGLPANVEAVTVSSVTDGDTIRVRFADGHEDKVRLILIDSPETVDPNTPEECFGKRASEYTSDRLSPGTKIWLERDVSDRDQYGRLVRYVWWNDGSGHADLLNERIVRDGVAVLSTYPPDVKYEQRIKAAQDAAVAANAGLWGACGGPNTPANPPAPASVRHTSSVSSGSAQNAPVNTGGGGGCDPSYPGVCIPPPPPDLDCGDISYRGFTVLPPDPHHFDGDHDGIGCEG
jgi:micrococcal nuclease